jgi:hypothetical protein
VSETATAPGAVSEAVWRRAVMYADMPTTRKAVAVAVALHADYRTGFNARPSNATVARLAGLTGKTPGVTANRHVRALVKAGWLTPTGKAPKGVIVYCLTLPDGAGMTQESHNLITN